MHNRISGRYSPLTERRDGIYLFILCFTDYVVTYLGRLNWSAAMASLVEGGVMTKDAVGTVATAFYAFYGGGQFLNGYLGDKLSPFLMIGAGITLSGMMNILMGPALSGSYTVLIVIWAINGLAQSSIWSPLIRIISTVLPETQRGPACSYMLISTAIGTLGSYLLSTAVINSGSNSAVFTLPGIILIVSGVLWFILTARVIKRVRRVSADRTKPADEIKVEKKEKKESIFSLLYRSGVLFMLFPAAMMALMKDGINTWTPTAITDIFGVSATLSVLVTTLLPLANVFGATISHFIVERRFHNEMSASAFFFAVATALEAALFIFGRGSLPAMIIIMALTSAILVAASNIFVTFVPSCFGRYNCVSTMTGIVNATANLFCSLSSLIIGHVTESAGGWDEAIILWFIFGVAGTVSSLLIIRRWGRFNSEK